MNTDGTGVQQRALNRVLAGVALRRVQPKESAKVRQWIGGDQVPGARRDRRRPSAVSLR
jgi:hypothetical protein